MTTWRDWALLALCVALAVAGACVNLSCAHTPDACPPKTAQWWGVEGGQIVDEGCVEVGEDEEDVE